MLREVRLDVDLRDHEPARSHIIRLAVLYRGHDLIMASDEVSPIPARAWSDWRRRRCPLHHLDLPFEIYG